MNIRQAIQHTKIHISEALDIENEGDRFTARALLQLCVAAEMAEETTPVRLAKSSPPSVTKTTTPSGLKPSHHK